MGKLSTAIAFLTGAAVGGAAVWYITKEWYARLTEEEINSVKEAYALYGHKQKKKRRKPRRFLSQPLRLPRKAVSPSTLREFKMELHWNIPKQLYHRKLK